MTPEQVILVQTSFERILPIASQAAALFYRRLFVLDPALRALFKGDMAEQGRKLMTMLRMVIVGLDRLETLLQAIEQLGARHHSYGVQAEHLATFAAALLLMLEHSLGELWTLEVGSAWVSAYQLLAATMLEAAPVAA
jgi:hemoglobin-like flavoprotein